MEGTPGYLEPKPLDANTDIDKNNEPLEVPDYVKDSLENKEGIDETVDVLETIFAFVEGIIKSKEDGFGYDDIFKFYNPVKTVGECIDGIEKVPAEISDLITDKEKEKLRNVINKYDIGEAAKEDVDDALAILIHANRILTRKRL